ncbi:acyltransferase [Acidovorax sp. IB03]|uniref:acyltransferase n=1 Tax=Acidovorax sp. IB03 TaxID=2779366 RepID=UPI0018E7600E|nr:acyltransferase [Acidovorax sp. IB03]
MLRVIKKIIPKKFVSALRGFLYFKGIYSLKPKVYCVQFKNKRLFLSNTIDVTHWSKLDIGNNVFIWHFTILDTFNGVKIGDDCQIGTRVGIFTHSSHNSIRIYNNKYHDTYFDSHQGRKKGSVEVGANTFVGANSIIMPGTKIGKGSIVGAFSYVSGEFPDFSIIAGNPAKKIGDVRPIDLKLLKQNPELIDGYLKAFQASSLDELMGDYLVK